MAERQRKALTTTGKWPYDIVVVPEQLMSSRPDTDVRFRAELWYKPFYGHMLAATRWRGQRGWARRDGNNVFWHWMCTRNHRLRSRELM